MGDMADDFTPRYGEVEQMAPGTRRVLARHAGPFTYYGTGTSLIGNGAVPVTDPGPAAAANVHALRPAPDGSRPTHHPVPHTPAENSPETAPCKAATAREPH